MTEAQKGLLIVVAELLAAEYPDKLFGSYIVSELHRCLAEVKAEA